MTPTEHYTLTLGDYTAQVLPIMFRVSPELAEAVSYLGAKHSRDFLVEATKREAAYSMDEYVAAQDYTDEIKVIAAAVDRILGALVHCAHLTRIRVNTLRAAEEAKLAEEKSAGETTETTRSEEKSDTPA